jgi:hypothetical protein
MTPFLTIYTPTYKRPKGLEQCRASVRAQDDPGIEHLIIEDTVGLGVGGMFADIPNHPVRGEWVYFLSDDDRLADPQVVSDFRAQAFDADVVMCRSTIGQHIFPSAQCWGHVPLLGHVTLSNWIVRADVWRSVPYGEHYEGDFAFIRACWDRGLRFAWWDRFICHADGWGQGRPE